MKRLAFWLLELPVLLLWGAWTLLRLYMTVLFMATATFGIIWLAWHLAAALLR